MHSALKKVITNPVEVYKYFTIIYVVYVFGDFSLSISGENCQLMIQRTNRTLYKGQVRFFPHIINTHHSYNTAIMLSIIRLLVRLTYKLWIHGQSCSIDYGNGP